MKRSLCPFCGAKANDLKDCLPVSTGTGDIYHCYCYDCGKEWVE